jgi:hypothetical protein
LSVRAGSFKNLTTDQRERRLNQLLIFKQRNNDDVTSSDGSLTVPLVARVASKPEFFINERRLFYTNIQIL